MENDAYLIFKRWPGWVYKIRRFDIFVDDQKVGSIGDGQQEKITVPAGQHSVELRVSWVIKSQIQIVDLQPDETILLECGSALSVIGILPFLIPLVFIFPYFGKFIQGQFVNSIIAFMFSIIVLIYGIWLFVGRGKFIRLNEPKRA